MALLETWRNLAAVMELCARIEDDDKVEEVAAIMGS